MPALASAVQPDDVRRCGQHLLNLIATGTCGTHQQDQLWAAHPNINRTDVYKCISPELTRLAKDGKNSAGRASEACLAVEFLSHTGREAFSTLTGLLNSYFQTIRMAAANGLVKTGGIEAKPFLRELLGRRHDPDLICCAVRGIGELANAGAEFIPALRDLGMPQSPLGHWVGFQNQTLPQALGRIGKGDPEAAVNAIIDVFFRSSKPDWAHVIAGPEQLGDRLHSLVSALERIGPAGRPISQPFLEEIVARFPRSFLANRAQGALERITFVPFRPDKESWQGLIFRGAIEEPRRSARRASLVERAELPQPVVEILTNEVAILDTAGVAPDRIEIAAHLLKGVPAQCVADGLSSALEGGDFELARTLLPYAKGHHSQRLDAFRANSYDGAISYCHPHLVAMHSVMRTTPEGKALASDALLSAMRRSLSGADATLGIYTAAALRGVTDREILDVAHTTFAAEKSFATELSETERRLQCAYLCSLTGDREARAYLLNCVGELPSERKYLAAGLLTLKSDSVDEETRAVLLAALHEPIPPAHQRFFLRGLTEVTDPLIERLLQEHVRRELSRADITRTYSRFNSPFSETYLTHRRDAFSRELLLQGALFAEQTNWGRAAPGLALCKYDPQALVALEDRSPGFSKAIEVEELHELYLERMRTNEPMPALPDPMTAELRSNAKWALEHLDGRGAYIDHGLMALEILGQVTSEVSDAMYLGLSAPDWAWHAKELAAAMLLRSGFDATKVVSTMYEKLYKDPTSQDVHGFSGILSAVMAAQHARSAL